jgi:hypothetical protein
MPRRRSIVSRAVAVVALGAALGSAHAEDAPPAVETTILRRVKVDAESVDGASLTVAPRSAHVAFLSRRPEGWAWFVDGTAGPTFDEVGPLVFSEDGARSAYLGRKKGDWTLVVDGVGKAIEVVRPPAALSLRFSLDGKRLAFSGTKVVDGKPVGEAVVVDGVAGPPFRGLQYASIVFSRDGKRVAYEASDGKNGFVVVDGKAGKPYPRDAIGFPVFSADGAHVAYTVRDDDGRFVVTDGVEGARFDALGPPTFAPAGGRLVYVGGRAGENVVVTDGVEGKSYDEVAAPGPVWSADGAHVAFAAKVGTSYLVVADGKEGPTYARVGSASLRWSPVGGRLAYWAGKGPRPFYVVDGVERKEADLVSDSGGAAFSHDGKHVAYAVRRSGKWVVRTDEIDGPEVDGVGKGFPVFSPSGRVTYEAAIGRRWHLFSGNEPGPAFEGFAEGALAFASEGTSVGVVARRGNAWRVVVDGIEGGEAYQAVLPGSELIPDGPRSFHAWFARDQELLHTRTARVR